MHRFVFCVCKSIVCMAIIQNVYVDMKRKTALLAFFCFCSLLSFCFVQNSAQINRKISVWVCIHDMDLNRFFSCFTVLHFFSCFSLRSNIYFNIFLMSFSSNSYKKNYIINYVFCWKALDPSTSINALLLFAFSLSL